jgi:GNAT superfamily N-acetyltransferase
MKLRFWRRRPSLGPISVIDLPDRHLASYFACLEDWSSEMKEAGDHKARWYERMKDQGLRVKLAVDRDDVARGMIQYVPVESSPADGHDLFMILCIWVHGYEQGSGNAQGRGIGTALLEAAERDARRLGAKGMAAWGLRLPIWMKAGWYKGHGYQTADRHGIQELVWKPFDDDAVAPRWVDEQPVEIGSSDMVSITAYNSGWCPAMNIVYERAGRAAAELGDDVEFSTIDIGDRQTFLTCGRTDAVYVDGQALQKGAPPSYDRVRRTIEKRVRRLQAHR